MNSSRLIIRIVGVVLTLTFNSPALADSYALIMGVSGYAHNPLPGVPKDRDNARQIARSMGIPNENIDEKKESELTLEGLRRALRQFQLKVKPGDSAFIYFSGHGTSRSNGRGGCEQALVTQDNQFMPKAEFHEALAPIQRVASKTFVFLDTCFAGGVVSSSRADLRSGKDIALRPKFMMSKLSNGLDDSCADAVNYSKALRDFDDIQIAQSTPNN